MISCANKLGGGWEREKAQRAAKRYDEDGQDKDIGARLLLLAAAIIAARALPPQNEHVSNDKEKGHEEKILAALRRVEPDGYGAPYNF